MAVAPLSISHLGSVVALDELADIAGAAVSPYRTPLPLRCVDAMATTLSAAAHLIPVTKDPYVSLVDDNERYPGSAGVVGEALSLLMDHLLGQSSVVARPAPPPAGEVLQDPVGVDLGGDLDSAVIAPSSAQPVMSPSPASPRTAFIFKAVKPVGAILPAPPAPKRRKKTLLSNFVPRRSRRVANLPPATEHSAAVSVCRHLGFSDGEERVSSASLENYAAMFDQPLSREHLKALTALFGWDAPPSDEVRDAGSILVV